MNKKGKEIKEGKKVVSSKDQLKTCGIAIAKSFCWRLGGRQGCCW